MTVPARRQTVLNSSPSEDRCCPKFCRLRRCSIHLPDLHPCAGDCRVGPYSKWLASESCAGGVATVGRGRMRAGGLRAAVLGGTTISSLRRTHGPVANVDRLLRIVAPLEETECRADESTSTRASLFACRVAPAIARCLAIRSIERPARFVAVEKLASDARPRMRSGAKWRSGVRAGRGA